MGDSSGVSVVEVCAGSVRIAVEARGCARAKMAALSEFRTVPSDAKDSAKKCARSDSHLRADRRQVDSSINFPEGILGMGDNKAFVLYDLDDNHRALVARDEPALSLLLMDPLRIDPDYPIDRAFACYPFDDEELALAAVVTLPIDGSTARVNLAAPVVFGVESRRAVQVILDDDRFSVRAPMYPNLVELQAPSAAEART
jgi:flagellar assembly factor FliW